MKPNLKAGWDDLCHRCGKCCMMPDGTNCRYLLKNKLCRLYPNHEGTPLAPGYQCMSILTFFQAGNPLPAGCGYEVVLKP